MGNFCFFYVGYARGILRMLADRKVLEAFLMLRLGFGAGHVRNHIEPGTTFAEV